MIHPSSTIMSSMMRPPTSVARQTAVYLRRGAPCEVNRLRHSSGSTLARRFRGGDFECIDRLRHGDRPAQFYAATSQETDALLTSSAAFGSGQMPGPSEA